MNFQSSLLHYIQQRILQISEALLLLLFGLSLIAVIHPGARLGLREWFTPRQRILLSSAELHSPKTGKVYRVTKVRSGSDLMIEVYEGASKSTEMINSNSIETFVSPTRLHSRTLIAQARDAYFNFDGTATHLGIADVDNDGMPEILVPNFDRDLIGHLNIYNFNENIDNEGLRQSIIN